MNVVNLMPIPNQSLTVQFGDNIWELIFKETKGVMSVTVRKNNVLLLSNSRLAPGTPVLPYRFQEDGNFYFLTNNGDYPYYTEFGKTQTLVYASQGEIDAARGT